jgi:hypothetical protein
MTDGSDELTCFARAPAAPSSGGRKPVVRSIPGGTHRVCSIQTSSPRVPAPGPMVYGLHGYAPGGEHLTCVVPNPGRRMR